MSCDPICSDPRWGTELYIEMPGRSRVTSTPKSGLNQSGKVGGFRSRMCHVFRSRARCRRRGVEADVLEPCLHRGWDRFAF